MSTRSASSLRADPSVAVAVAAGCAALLMRTISYSSIGVTALIGIAGVLAPAPAAGGRFSRVRWVVVTIAGTLAFASTRWIAAPVGSRLTRLGILTIVIAAVAEEAFFRRFVYAWLARHGAAAAIGGSAILFAVIHVSTYGSGALPIDLAAGALLGWQRWASGTWTAPAATHVVANLLQMG